MGFGVASHRNKGWHVTATAGTFGAAAAAAKLLRLNEEQTLSAFGMAGTQSFGLWAFLGDGSSCKVLHPARAAVNGTEAALLAQSGMTGPEHILDAFDGGLFAAMSDASDLTLVSRGLGSHFELLYMDKKPYPCCRSTHCAIDAALAIKEATGITADEIKSVHVDTYLVGYKQCGVSEGSIRPEKPIDAKFSTPYAVAAAFLYGEVSLRQFDQVSIDDPAIQALVKRITVASADRFTLVYPAHWGCALYITCKDGRVLEKEVPDASGSVANPLNKKQAKAKARALIREVYPVQAEAIAEMILSISTKLKIPSL